MFLQHLKLSKVRHSAVVGLVFLICVISSATFTVSQSNAQAATTNLPNEIRIGIRTIVPLIGKYQRGTTDTYAGFCAEFGKQLAAKLGTRVKYREIKNEFIDPNHPRWDALLTDNLEDRQDIQCGPNSWQRRDNDKIIFSNSNFYETGIKLFLKKTVLDKNLDQNDPSSLIKKIKIGVVKDTTTYDQLKNRRNISLRSTKKQVLEDLESQTLADALDAFASDGIILRELLEQKDTNGKSYKDKGYVLFPEGSNYLINPKTEEYVIAISNKGKNQKYSSELLSATNAILNSKFKDDWQQKLSKYEYDGTISIIK